MYFESSIELLIYQANGSDTKAINGYWITLKL